MHDRCKRQAESLGFAATPETCPGISCGEALLDLVGVRSEDDTKMKVNGRARDRRENEEGVTRWSVRR